MKIGIKEVVAMGLGTALFVVLTNVQIPVFIVPNTSLQPRMAILAFLAAAFGPVVGAVVGFLGHALGDAIFYGSVWWSWVFPEAVVGAAIGIFAKKFAVKEGGFTNSVNLICSSISLRLLQTQLHGYLWHPFLTSLSTKSLPTRYSHRALLLLFST